MIDSLKQVRDYVEAFRNNHQSIDHCNLNSMVDRLDEAIQDRNDFAKEAIAEATRFYQADGTFQGNMTIDFVREKRIASAKILREHSKLVSALQEAQAVIRLIRTHRAGPDCGKPMSVDLLDREEAALEKYKEGK